MPSMYVNVPKLDQPTKDTLAAKLYEAASTILKVPHIFTYVNEYETIYTNGQPTPDQKMVVLNIEAGMMKPEKMETLGGILHDAVKVVLGEDKKLTLVFHSNDMDHIVINGKSLTTSMKK